MKKIDQALFGYGSATTLGVYRICIGLVALLNWLFIFPFIEDWYSEKGFVPVRAASIWNGDEFKFNPLAWVTDMWVIQAVFVILIIASILTILGLYTRLATIVLFIGTVALHQRNPIILHSGDTLLRLSCLTLALAPCGAACSLDRLVRISKGILEQPMVSLWPQRLIQFEMAVMYFTTFWHKCYGQTWLNGTATWYPPRLSEFYRFPVPPILDSLPVIKAATYGTLFVEAALGTLVFYRPLRKWVLLAGVLLHLGIEWRMNIPLFSYIVFSQYVSHYEGTEVSGWARRMGDRFKGLKLKLSAPSGIAFDSPAANLWRAVDPFGFLHVQQGTGEGWSASTEEGKKRPTAAAWSRSIGAWILTPMGFFGLLKRAEKQSHAAQT